MPFALAQDCKSSGDSFISAIAESCSLPGRLLPASQLYTVCGLTPINLLNTGADKPFFSRIFERQADRYAISLTGDARNFASALEKLATVNCAARSSGIGEWFGSHPDIEKRIAAAMR